MQAPSRSPASSNNFDDLIAILALLSNSSTVKAEFLRAECYVAIRDSNTVPDGPIPFVMSGWRVVAGEEPYKGQLVNGDRVVTADLLAQAWSNIIREKDE